MAVERFLSIDFNCREYMVDRIRQLAQGSCMSQFKWNSGGSRKDKTWNNQNFPSDSYLVMHLFCRFMDEHVPGSTYGSDFRYPFSSKYFVQAAGGKFPGVRIRQASKFPAHFQILVDDTVYDVQSVPSTDIG